jgi:hypothetical protein
MYPNVITVPQELINEFGGPEAKRYTAVELTRNVKKPEKLDKIPYYRNGAGVSKLDGANPLHWMTYLLAEALRRELRYPLLGVMLAGGNHGINVYDFDDCLEDPVTKRFVNTDRGHLAQGLITRLRSATFLSASGTGLHVWIIDRTKVIKHKGSESNGVGIYNYENGRFIAEQFMPYGEHLPIREITDPNEAQELYKLAWANTQQGTPTGGRRQS